MSLDEVLWKVSRSTQVYLHPIHWGEAAEELKILRPEGSERLCVSAWSDGPDTYDIQITSIELESEEAEGLALAILRDLAERGKLSPEVQSFCREQGG